MSQDYMVVFLFQFFHILASSIANHVFSFFRDLSVLLVKHNFRAQAQLITILHGGTPKRLQYYIGEGGVYGDLQN